MKTRRARGLLIALAIGGMDVAGGAGIAPASAALEAQVRDLIGDAACNSDDQCRTLAFGAKACGGPQSYLAWSTMRTDEAELRAAADRYTESRRQDARASRSVSNCVFVTDPGAYCTATASGPAPSPPRVCRLRGARSRGGPPVD